MSFSWGFTDNDQYTMAGFKMNYFDLANYAKIKDDNSSKEYVNLTCPVNQQEHVHVRAEALNSVSTSFKKVYPSSAKGGYQFSVKDEMVGRNTDADGNNYDDYARVTITCAASDGTNVTNGLVTGADWLPLIMRAVSRLANVTYDISDGTVTVKATQTQLDHLMHGSSELVMANTSQA